MSRSTVKATMVFGADEIISNIEKILGNVEKTAIKNAVREAANVIRREAVKRVPVKSGILKRSIVVKVAKTRHPGAKTPYLGIVQVARKAYARPAEGGTIKTVDRRVKNAKGRLIGRRYSKGDIYPRNYAHLVHEGVRPHVKKGRRGIHPGFKAVRFFADALIISRDRALDAFKSRLMGEMVKGVLAKGRRRAG